MKTSGKVGRYTPSDANFISVEEEDLSSSIAGAVRYKSSIDTASQIGQYVRILQNEIT